MIDEKRLGELFMDVFTMTDDLPRFTVYDMEAYELLELAKAGLAYKHTARESSQKTWRDLHKGSLEVIELMRAEITEFKNTLKLERDLHLETTQKLREEQDIHRNYSIRFKELVRRLEKQNALRERYEAALIELSLPYSANPPKEYRFPDMIIREALQFGEMK